LCVSGLAESGTGPRHTSRPRVGRHPSRCDRGRTCPPALQRRGREPFRPRFNPDRDEGTHPLARDDRSRRLSLKCLGAGFLERPASSLFHDRPSGLGPSPFDCGDGFIGRLSRLADRATVNRRRRHMRRAGDRPDRLSLGLKTGNHTLQFGGRGWHGWTMPPRGRAGKFVADGVGFEPTVRLPIRRFSRPLP
jgi:hypothetical protein